MRNNETGEFELVVGNKQLLSGFFIVVLLFAVAFAMGYVVGQNSPHAGKVESAATSAAVTPTEARPPASGPPAAAPANPPADSAAAAQPPADSQPQPSTQPARDPQVTASAAPVPSAAAPAPAATAPDAPAGSYWQIVATANQESAHAMLQTLKDKGFPASLSPGPNNLTRVLVGPYSDTATMARAKTDLENAGFRPVRH
jgi:cell division septation protein DedD